MDTKDSACPICLESFNDKIIGSPDVCDHKFCVACLERWTKHGNFCPVDKQKFKKIISGNEVIPIKYKRKKRGLDLYDISVHCEVCKDIKEGNDTVILCDTCDLAYHLDCLNPPLKSIPAGNWDCPDCKEILRKKKLKYKKTKDKGKHKTSTNSKQSSSLFHRHLTSRTKHAAINKVSSGMDRNANLKFSKTNFIKQSSFSEIDYGQEKNSCTETVSSSDNCAKTLPGEFEDFLSISDNGVILTKRKLLNTEAKTFNKNFGNGWTNAGADFQLSRHVKNATRSSFEMLQTERKTKRLAATIANSKIHQNLNKNNDSSEQYSDVENNSMENASLTTENHFVDIKKSILPRQSCILPFYNKKATNYEELSLSKPESMNKLGLKEIPRTHTNVKSTDSAAVDLNNTDFLCVPETGGWKTSPVSITINNSEAENLNNAWIHAESFNHKNATNCTDKISLSEPKSVIEMGLKDIEGISTLMENLNKNAASTSSRIDCENLTTDSAAESADTATESTDTATESTYAALEDLISTDSLLGTETGGWKPSPTSTEINNSKAENTNNTRIHAESFNDRNVTNNSDEFSLSKPNFVNELEGTEGKDTFMENLDKNTASKLSDIGHSENLTAFTNVKSADSVSKDFNRFDFLSASQTAGWRVFLTKTKINNSLAEVANNTKNHTISKSSDSKEPDVISPNCEPILVKEKSSNKRTRKESSGSDSSVNCRTLRKKLRLQPRTKRLAAANAIYGKKWIENQSSSGDESSNSSDKHSVTKKGCLKKSQLKTSNHYLFENIEKALSHQDSPLPVKNDRYSSSKSESNYVTSDSESSEGIKEKNNVMEDLNRSVESKSASLFENSTISSILKVSPCITESLSVFEKPGCKSSSECTKIKNSVADELRNVQIHMKSKSFSVSEKPTIEEPPELTLEPLKTPLRLGNEIPPELLIEPLNVTGEVENGIPPITKENETKQGPSLVGDWENRSLSSAFSIFEKITNTFGSTKKQSSSNRTTNEKTQGHMRGCQNANNLENVGLSRKIDNSSDMEVDGEENILDSFHIREVHYAIKAKMNLPSELQKIERETWLSHQSKSSRKYKYKSSSKDAEIHISSSSHHQIASGNEQLYNFFQRTQLGCNNSTHTKDLAECNKFNPFCESVSSNRPKKLFKVTEYKLQPSDKQFCFNKIPKNVLQSIMGPYSVHHLDMREDGSLFLNWTKSKSC